MKWRLPNDRRPGSLSSFVHLNESNANMTGVTYSSADLARGWLSLLKEIRPLSRVAVVSGADPASRAELTNLQTAAANAGAKIQPYAVQDGDALGGLFAGPPTGRAEAIIVLGGPVTLAHLPRIVDLAGERCQRGAVDELRLEEGLAFPFRQVGPPDVR